MKNLHDNIFKVFDIKRQPFKPKKISNSYINIEGKYIKIYFTTLLMTTGSTAGQNQTLF